MIYANMLSNAVVESGWSYYKIVEKCRTDGVPFSRSYLSKLCTGSMPPASDKINQALVDALSPVTGITYKDLSVAKYKEIVPKDVLEALASCN
jgi:hypothetical protein